jgi:heme/copper-type cytochrome/quinol oxidase subunit 3
VDFAKTLHSIDPTSAFLVINTIVLACAVALTFAASRANQDKRTKVLLWSILLLSMAMVTDGVVQRMSFSEATSSNAFFTAASVVLVGATAIRLYKAYS